MAAHQYIPYAPRTHVKIRDIAGQRFGRLIAIRPMRRVGDDKCTFWRCVCDCGNETTVNASSLFRGLTKSCGCFRNESTGARHFKHGMSDQRIHGRWMNIVSRCTKPDHPDYPRYGGRGITIDPRWLVFENFYADMGEPPHGLSIDRIDNDGPYCKENCRWATRKEQNNNQRRSHIIEFNGQRMTLAMAAELVGMPALTISKRLKRGWDIARAMTEPLRLTSRQSQTKTVNRYGSPNRKGDRRQVEVGATCGY